MIKRHWRTKIAWTFEWTARTANKPFARSGAGSWNNHKQFAIHLLLWLEIRKSSSRTNYEIYIFNRLQFAEENSMNTATTPSRNVTCYLKNLWPLLEYNTIFSCWLFSQSLLITMSILNWTIINIIVFICYWYYLFQKKKIAHAIYFNTCIEGLFQAFV